MALVGCESAPTQIECVNIASGEKLTDTDIPWPEAAQHGFTGTDKDGFTRNVNKQQAPWWKCRVAARRTA